MEFGNKIIPEVIWNFQVYDGDGANLVGTTAEMTLANLESVVATINGGGILGSYDVPVLGHFGSITQDIPFRILYKPVLEFANPMKPVNLNIRGAIQVTDKDTGVSDFASFRYIVKGRCKSMTPGSMNPGNPMGASLSVEVTYLLYEIDGEKMIELDKLNSVYRINGVDLLEKARKMC